MARHLAPFSCRQTIAEMVRRRSFGCVLPLGRHASTNGSKLVQCASVSMAPPPLSRGAKRPQPHPVQARTGPRCDLVKLSEVGLCCMQAARKLQEKSLALGSVRGGASGFMQVEGMVLHTSEKS